MLDLNEVDDLGDAIRDMTDGRGPDSVIDAVGMEAHGSPVAQLAQQITGLLPDAIAAPLMQKAGVDRLAALHSAIDIVRRGGTISLIGVYGGMADPMPMMTMFDKQIQLRMGQANVKRWVDDIMPLLTDDDPLGVDTFATHRLPLPRRRTPTRSSRRSRTARSRSSCNPDGARRCGAPPYSRPAGRRDGGGPRMRRSTRSLIRTALMSGIERRCGRSPAVRRPRRRTSRRRRS